MVTLRTDPLGKAFGQLMLAMPVDAPVSLLEAPPEAHVGQK